MAVRVTIQTTRKRSSRVPNAGALPVMDVLPERNGIGNGSLFENLLASHARAQHLDMKPGAQFTDPADNRIHAVDFAFNKYYPKGEGADVVIASTKVQNVPGSAEEKVIYEIDFLSRLRDSGQAQRIYLVLDGIGWSRTGLDRIQRMAAEKGITVVTLDQMQDLLSTDKY